MCVDIGHMGVEVVVGRGSKVLFSRCLTNEPTAEGKQNGSLPEEISACLESFHAAFPTPAFAVKRIVLSGGGDLVEGVAARVSEATGVKVVRLAQWVRRFPMADVERYGCAIGLAACGLRRGGAGISLLPRALRESRILRWQKQYWLLSAFALVGVLLVLIGGASLQLRWDREYLRLRQVELAGLHALDRKLVATENLNEHLEARIAPFRTAVENAAVLRLALQAVSQVKHPDDWLSLLADADAYFGVSAADQMGGGDGMLELGESADIVSVIVEGYTPVDDFSTVGEMIERLYGQEGVLAADLLGDERLRDDPVRDERWADTGCSLFVIEMMLETP
jgi:hypothetical protein